jgi:hypothetical protein
MASLVKGVIGGTFSSIGALSGSLYTVVAESSFGSDTRGQDKATNIGMGLVYAGKGIGMELGQGIAGVFTRPY